MEPREAYCHLLAAVYAADGPLTDDEHAALDEAMNEHGLVDQERQRVLLLNGHDVAIQVMKDSPPEDRQMLLDQLVAAALEDGKLTHSETERVKQIGDALEL